MKKMVLTLIFLLTALAAFSQRLSIVAIFPFESTGTGLTAGDAASLTNQLITELSSWGTLNLLTGDNPENAKNAEYLVKGQLARQNNQVVLTATTYDAKTNKALNTARAQADTSAALSSQIFVFAAQVTENVPFPNYLLGKWRAVINMNDGPLTCILEFRSNRTIIVERYDTWEHREGTNALRYQGFGTGTYSYWGHARRMVRGTPVDGFVTINLKLEDALPKYTALSQSRLNLNFDEEKNNFELVSTGFFCGDNFSGPSVYPSAAVAYTQFTKIQ
jgi:TolB-like protein